MSAAPVPSADVGFVFRISIGPGLDHVPFASVPVLGINERNRGRIAYVAFGCLSKYRRVVVRAVASVGRRV